MTKKGNDALIPILIILSIFAVYLALMYLPVSIFGAVWSTDVAPLLWVFMPWLIILAAAFCVLFWLVRQK